MLQLFSRVENNMGKSTVGTWMQETMVNQINETVETGKSAPETHKTLFVKQFLKKLKEKTNDDLSSNKPKSKYGISIGLFKQFLSARGKVLIKKEKI